MATETCTHEGIGLPDCLTCGAREEHEGGTRPDTIEGLRRSLAEVRAERDIFDEDLRRFTAFKKFELRVDTEGVLTLMGTPAEPLMAWICNVLANVFTAYPEAKNYIETRVSWWAIPTEEGRHADPVQVPAVVTIQRLSGQTPHELRQAAETQRDEAIAKLQQAESELARLRGGES